MKRNLTASIEVAKELVGSPRAQMFSLYDAYYSGADEATFVRDLEAKSHVILLRDEANSVQGFSTLQVWTATTADNGPATIIYSGDTIIDQAYWGSQLLPLTWIEFAGEIKAQRSHHLLYWLLISKGHRTYRLLPAFAIQFYPTWRAATPASIASMMRSLGQEQFGHRFDPAANIVRHEENGPALKPAFAGLDERRLGHPDVSCFHRLNPGHAAGDELLCLCELSAENLRPMARSRFLRGYDRARLGAAA